MSKSQVLHIIRCLMLTSLLGSSALGEEPPSFFRGLNLNGSAVVIDGNAWEGSEATFYHCQDKAIDKQEVPLAPATDADRAKMIRSSRWGGNRVELDDIPAGTYSLFLYVWEDNNAETYSISVNGREVLPQYNSGSTGHWEKLGPWFITPNQGRIEITSRGGAANFSGIEIWRGRYDGIHDPISEEELAFFEKRVRPLLVEKCYECHSAESDQAEGELLVDSRATLRRGGIGGPAVVPGDPEQSLLIKAVRYADDLQMPPDEKLSDAEIADLEQWVRSGAADPRSLMTKHSGKKIDIATAQQFWSLQPIRKPDVPPVADKTWPRTDIDRFVLAKLEQLGLNPGVDADKRALIRRATYDLTGLPPTTEEVSDFLGDESPLAFQRVVERLLSSPRYGERWGRHWLDVIRYADTAGDNSDYPVPQMHRYRDWVIDSLNRDLRFDEFVRDQLAGDLRGGVTEQERMQRIIATGYLANSRRFGSRVDDYPWHLTIEDTIDNLGRAFLGVTLSCARCHDHKFDPITTHDYYGLYGVFSSTRYPWPGIELDKRQRDFVALVPQEELAGLRKQQEERERRQEELDRVVSDLKDSLKSTPDAEKDSVKAKIKEAEQLAKEFSSQPPLFETAYAVQDVEHPQDAVVQLKGDPAKPGDIVRRHFPAVLAGEDLPESCQQSGRLELAEWIVADDNPLPVRVIVNRIWQYHFGRGIVPTPNDFGKQGKPPTHPELLDYLASHFRENDWSIKSLHRHIMLSRVYQQSSRRDAQSVASDPANDYLSGFRRQRLDAEAIRDTMLVLGGNLDFSSSGEHPFPVQSDWDFTQHKPFKDVYESNRRSLYLMTQRIQRHPYLAIFDGADPSTSTAIRSNSTTPLQALFLLNDPLVHEQSTRIADRITSASNDLSERVELAYQLCFSRPATTEEIEVAQRFFQDARQLLQNQHASPELFEAETWQAYVRSLLRLNEFVYVD